MDAHQIPIGAKVMRAISHSKPSTIRRIKQDPAAVRITELILAQNAKILEMNARLLADINQPAMIVSQSIPNLEDMLK